MLVVSVNGELLLSKEIEELLKTVRSSIYIYRNKDVTGPQHIISNIEEAPPPAQRPYSSR